MKALASFAYLLAICGLFALARDRQARTSRALWLPVIWLIIAGSQAVSQWLAAFGIGNGGEGFASPDQYMDGSPLDRNVYTLLLALGLVVLFGRSQRLQSVLRLNKPILFFVLYCAISVMWSDFPLVAFKRWIKSLGDFVMVLIILTDPNRKAAIRRALSRAGFILLPCSLLLNKYYPEIGRYYDRWVGTQYFRGVAPDKNMLGLACLTFGLASCWQLIEEIGGARRRRVLVAHGTLVLLAVWLLKTCNSMTSLSCFLLASSLMAAHAAFKTARKPAVIHLMVLSMLLLCSSTLFLGMAGGLLQTLGRDPTLTGRTVLWSQILELSPNPVLGAGFESFWLGERLKKLWTLYWWHPTESHNGYIEVYLNLGWIGIALLVVLLLSSYRNIIGTLKRDPEAGRIRLAYFFVGVAYNFTEAAIRTTDLAWIAFILAAFAVPRATTPKTRSAHPPPAQHPEASLSSPERTGSLLMEHPSPLEVQL